VSEAVASAKRAQESGILVFTIGLGNDLDVDALREMASRPEYFYVTPDAAELAEIYASIAGAIPCPPSSFWGRR
jgi:hypothetical protein